MNEEIQDSLGRHFKSLRLSVVPYCNLACTYCTDTEFDSNSSKESLDPDAFISLLSHINPYLNLYSVRLTGGEPTLYKQLPELVQKLKHFGIKKVHLTSNGVFLPNMIQDLKAAGLDSVNISLDAMSPDISQKMSRRKLHSKILSGIESVLNEDIFLKLNTTVMARENVSEILPLLEYSKEKKCIIRYLELMEMGPLCGTSHKEEFFSAKQIKELIQERYFIREVPRKRSATAKYFKTNQGHHFGIIANYSHPFCSDCNRLRLDHEGMLYGCLSNSFGTSLRKAVENKGDLKELLSKELYKKQPVRFKASSLSMKAVGG